MPNITLYLSKDDAKAAYELKAAGVGLSSLFSRALDHQAKISLPLYESKMKARFAVGAFRSMPQFRGLKGDSLPAAVLEWLESRPDISKLLDSGKM